MDKQAPQANLVGPGFRQLSSAELIEVGDQYLTEEGKFETYSLEFVGRHVAPGLIARRIVRSMF